MKEAVGVGSSQDAKTREKPNKSTCLFCGGDPHGLDYVKTNSDGTIDTIRTQNKDQ